MKFWLLATTGVFVHLATGVATAESSDYELTIKPLLVAKCSACHGVLNQEAGLRLDAAQFIRAGGDSGPIVVADKASSSLLLERVATTDSSLRMPPEGEGEPLDETQVEQLANWINSGAILPTSETVPAGPEDHWAFQPPTRPPTPSDFRLESTQKRQNPIDAFLNLRHREVGLISTELADKATLLRRLYFDLIGLPPTRSDLNEFLEDDSPTAYTAVVDRLLATPEHGERWARHWMDVWRYSDWDGYKQQLRGSQRHIWRWRDWIIESLNADKGYDRMIVEMLAGDEVAPTDIDVLRATGFLARNYHKSNRDIWLDATVEHTAKAFLGLTINCARCHDHKYDPIPQRDYYSMRAIFEPHEVRIERLPGNANLTKQGLVRAYDAKPDANTYLYLAGNEKRPDKEHTITADVPAFLESVFKPQSVDLPVQARFPALREFVKREEIAAKRKHVETAQSALEKLQKSNSGDGVDDGHEAALALPVAHARFVAAKAALRSLEARWTADESKYRNQLVDQKDLAERAAQLERRSKLRASEVTLLEKEQAVLAAGHIDDSAKRKTALEKAKKERDAALKTLDNASKKLHETSTKYTSVGTTYPQSSTGRRLAFAQWITSPNNPLTARVAANHIWLRHFGQPLVANVFDFGLRSSQPEHIQLLDWLACELVEHDWSMKHIHRLIVTSHAFQRTSSASHKKYAVSQNLDPDNRMFWRANIRRLEAEVVRDSILAVSGSLDRTLGGPDIAHGKGEDVPRRSIYFQHAYEKQMRMLVLFEAANPTDCYRRVESVVPQQALALANSALSVEESRKLARSCSEGNTPDEEFLTIVFEKLLCRAPTENERTTCRRFLLSQASLFQAPDVLTAFVTTEKTSIPPADSPHLRARENLVHVLLNHNDFVTVR